MFFFYEWLAPNIDTALFYDRFIEEGSEFTLKIVLLFYLIRLPKLNLLSNETPSNGDFFSFLTYLIPPIRLSLIN